VTERSSRRQMCDVVATRNGRPSSHLIAWPRMSMMLDRSRCVAKDASPPLETPDEVYKHQVARGAYVDNGMAAFQGDLARVRALLDEDPSLADRVDDYNSYYAGCGAPLKNAAVGGHLEIVKLLLEHGANPNLPEEGIVPHGHALYSAVYHGHYEIARLLLERGAYPSPPVENSADAGWIARPLRARRPALGDAEIVGGKARTLRHRSAARGLRALRRPPVATTGRIRGARAGSRSGVRSGRSRGAPTYRRVFPRGACDRVGSPCTRGASVTPAEGLAGAAGESPEPGNYRDGQISNRFNRKRKAR